MCHAVSGYQRVFLQRKQYFVENRKNYLLALFIKSKNSILRKSSTFIENSIVVAKYWRKFVYKTEKSTIFHWVGGKI